MSETEFFEAVCALLASPEWHDVSSTRQLHKLELMEGLGCPPMRILPAQSLRENGCIPRSSDPHASVLAKDVLRQGGCVLVFLSHRWLQNTHPDDPQNSKCRLLVEWSDWYEQIYIANGTRKVYFWLDYACMDQDKPMMGLLSLPLYVAICSDFLCYETGDYDERAWCTVERMIAYAFTFAGKVPWVFPKEVTTTGQKHDHEKKFQYRAMERILQDPREGKLTDENDRKAIHALSQCSTQSKAWIGGDGKSIIFGETRVTAQVFTWGD